MNPIRLLALDLDNTLLRSDLSISFRTRNVIKKTESIGVTVVLTSSRVRAAIDHFSRLLGMHKRPGYIISNNGALVYESNTGKVIHEVRINPDIALNVCDLADAEGFPVQLYEGDTMYVSRLNEYAAYDQKVTGLTQVVADNFRDMVSRGCYKLIIPGDPMLLSPLESLIRTYLDKDISLLSCSPYFLEILPPETNKGVALAKIAESLGIKPGETMAIGDSMNDEAMIRWAGVGVCMVNGDERIKKTANLITDSSNDDDGVAEVIDKYLFGKE